jgi:hypothetical protein
MQSQSKHANNYNDTRPGASEEQRFNWGAR